MIYLECKPDEALVVTLGIPGKEIEHTSGKGSVCKKLEKSKHSKGLVDEDPSSIQPSYIKKLKTLSNKHYIKLLYDKNAENYLIILCPNLEVWILNATRDAEINIKNYNLPDNADELHKILNTKIGKFTNLLQTLIKEKSRMLKTLEDFIKSND
jgi:hypothetical protein